MSIALSKPMLGWKLISQDDVEVGCTIWTIMEVMHVDTNEKIPSSNIFSETKAVREISSIQDAVHLAKIFVRTLFWNVRTARSTPSQVRFSDLPIDN